MRVVLIRNIKIQTCGRRKKWKKVRGNFICTFTFIQPIVMIEINNLRNLIIESAFTYKVPERSWIIPKGLF